MTNFSYLYRVLTKFNIKNLIVTYSFSILFIPTFLLAIDQTKFYGYVEMPAARQLYCYKDGGFRGNPNGSDIPNLACREAYLKSGDAQFVQKQGYSAYVKDYNNLLAVKKVIPNGTLCAAGDPKKSGMDVVSPYWKKTSFKAGSVINFVFKAESKHTPSFWEIYITKSNFDPKKSVLRWEDLELLAKQGDIQPIDGYYRFNLKLPKNRKGDAILYTRWQKVTPSGKGYYNCSDITLK